MVLQEKKNTKKTYPTWCYKTKDDDIKVNITLLGKSILGEKDFLFIDNKDKISFYEYDVRKGCWFERPLGIIKNIIHDKLDGVNKWSSSLERAVYQYIIGGIQHKRLNETFNSQPRMAFNFANGVFDWNSMKLVQHSKEYYFTSCTNYNLNTEYTNTPETEKYFNMFFGENAQTMKEAIGYCFYPSYEPIQEFIILSGQGHDGKSPFLNNYLASLLGIENISGISLTDLVSNKDNNFKLNELFQKYANFSVELTDSKGTLLNTATIKMLTGGDLMNTSVKNKSDLKFKNFAKLFIATNELISFRDSSNGFERRIYIIDVNKFDDFEKTIDYQKLMNERSSFVYQCIRLAKKAMQKKELTITTSIKANRKNWFKDNDPIQQFIDEIFIIDKNERADQDDAFISYSNWCHDNGYKPLNKAKFKSQLQSKGFKFEQRRLGSKEHRYYKREFIGFSLNNKANCIAPSDYVVKRIQNRCNPK